MTTAKVFLFLIQELSHPGQESLSYGLPYLLGEVVGVLIFASITFLLAGFGLKLLKKKTVRLDSKDEIGT